MTGVRSRVLGLMQQQREIVASEEFVSAGRFLFQRI